MIATTDTYQRTITARIPITLRATDPVHHGAGTSGNTSLVRMQDSVAPDGDRQRTPYVSGNSVRHSLRDALAWLTVTTTEVPDGGMPKAAADLLWSGGALTRTGAQTDLHELTTRHRLLPSLPLLGYSLGSDLVRGSLRVSNAHLACTENAWRLPRTVMTDRAAGLRAVEWIGEEFGTRHDITGGPVDRLVEDAIFGTTTQMIYDMQVVQAGSLWHLTIDVDAATPDQIDALAAALDRLAVTGWRLGAKRAQGFGACQIVTCDTTSLVDDLGTAAARYIQHLTDHASEIRGFLRTVE
jgi:hypothetical protein